MKYLNLLLIALLAFLLVGCASEVEDSKEVTLEKELNENNAEGASDIVKEDSNIIEAEYDSRFQESEIMGTDNVDKVEEFTKVSDYSKVFPKTKKLNVGDKYQYAVAITNPNNEDFAVAAEVRFKDASSTGLSNKIPANPIYMNAWLQETDLGDANVPRNDMIVIPLNIQVGYKIDKDVDTQEGSYTYKLIVYENESMAWDKPKIYHESEFTVIVSE